MRTETFRDRMSLLRKWGFPILPLQQALTGLETGDYPDFATVITIDDGWHSTYRYGLPVLQELELPATVYVTTYCVERRVPEIATLLAYTLSNARRKALHLVDCPAAVGGPWDLTNGKERRRALSAVVAYAESRPFEQRTAFARQVVEAAGLDWERLESAKMFYLMDEGEVRALAEAGINIQLHTHRHRLPLHDRQATEAEIELNRRFLSALVPYPLDHLAYPRGEYQPTQFGWLEAAGIESAMTCEPGLNYADTPRLQLRRFLDGEDVSIIEFEAELCGLAHLIRRVAHLLGADAR
jgi:peptidoglycan/xylan/chitin deacetylase (PgdA/CDA1 family)